MGKKCVQAVYWVGKSLGITKDSSQLCFKIYSLMCTNTDPPHSCLHKIPMQQSNNLLCYNTWFYTVSTQPIITIIYLFIKNQQGQYKRSSS